MNNVYTGRSRLGFHALFAGLNVAVLASCNAASAHGASAFPIGHGSTPAVLSHHDSQTGFISPHFGGSIQGLIHPHSLQSPTNSFNQLAGSLPLTAYKPPTQNLSAAESIQLNLTSNSKTAIIEPGLIPDGTNVSILVGGVKTSLHTGESITPAELVALYQVLSGQQTIVLDRQGRADGGTFSLNSLLSSSGPIKISSIVVPQKVSAIDYLSSSNNLTLSGDLLNYGSIIEVSKTGQTQNLSANLSALDIVNEAGGLITSAGHGAASATELSLNAAKDFTNLGTITSSGGLSITAGGTLTNGATAGGALVKGAMASSISSTNDLNLQSTTIVNSGLISSSAGNINIGALNAQNINVNNSGGTLSAATGAINVRDAAYTGQGDTSITGGNLLSQQLNLNAGAGTINVSVDKLTGTVNATGNAVHVAAATQNLILGKQNLSGDPTYYNSSGDITIGESISVSEDLAIIASGNVNAGSSLDTISTSSGGQGHNILIVAGANVQSTGSGGDSTTSIPSSTASSSVSFSGASATGGDINLTGANASLTLNSTANANANHAGNITLAAFAVGNNGGHIILPNDSNIDASNSGSVNFGNVTLIAGAASGTAISIGSVLDLGPFVGANTIHLINAQPIVSGAPALVVGTNGTVTAGQLAPDYTHTGGGDVIVNHLLSSIAPIQIVAGGSISIVADDQNTGNDGIRAQQLGSSGPALTMLAGKNVTFNANLLTYGAAAVVAGGNISTGIGKLTFNVGGEEFEAGQGGDITIVAGAAHTFDGSITTITGASGQTSGNIDFSAGGGLSVFNSGSGLASGNITLAAFGSGAGGTINFGSSHVIQTMAGSGANNGNFTAVGNFTSTNGVDVTGGASGTGNIAISYTAPSVAAGNVVIGATGSITSGNFFGGASMGTATGNAFGTLKIDGGNLSISQGQSFTISSAIATGNVNQVVLQSQGGITLSASPASGTVNALTLQSVAADIDVSGSLISGGTLTSLVVQSAANINLLSNVVVNGNLILVTANNIDSNTNCSQISTASSTGNGGNIYMAAGALSAPILSLGATSAATVLGASTFGGFIDLTGSPSSLLITSAALGSTGNAGSITMLAFASTTGNQSFRGEMRVPAASIIDASSLDHTTGNVTIMAGGGVVPAPSAFNAIAIGNIQQKAGTASGADNVQLLNYQPLVGSGLSFDSKGAVTGSVTANYATAGGGGVLLQGTLQASAVVTIGAGTNIALGTSNINAYTVFATAGQAINSGNNISASGGIALIAGAGITETGSNKTLSTQTGLPGVNAGNVLIVSGAAFTRTDASVTITGASNAASSDLFASAASPSTIVTTALSGNAGNIILAAFGNSSTGHVYLGSTQVTSLGVNGASGNVELISGFQGAGGITSSTAINTSGSSAFSGNVTLSYTQPNATTLSPVIANQFGTITSGNLLGGALAAGGGGLLAALPNVNYGNITIIQAQPITINSTAFATGNISLLTVQSAGDITVQSAISALGVSLIAGGNINLSQAATFQNPSGIALVAGRNIETDTSVTNIRLNTSTPTGSGGAITIVAGAAFNFDGTNISITGASSTGGSIDLTQGTLTVFSTQATGVTGAAGNVTLTAFAGSDNTGNIKLNPIAVLRSAGNTNGGNNIEANGNVTIVAGQMTGTAISVGNINTTFNNALGDTNYAPLSGQILLRAATPNISSSKPLVVLTNGIITSGNPSGNNTAQTGANIDAGGLTSNSGAVYIYSSHDVVIGSINVSGAASSSHEGGSINVRTYGQTNADQLVIGAGTTNTVGTINASGDGTAARGIVVLDNIDRAGTGNGGIEWLGSSITNNGGGGGGLILNTGKAAGDVINLTTNTVIDYSESATSIGPGLVTIIGNNVTWTNKGSTPLVLKVDGSAGNAAGSIFYYTANNSTLNLNGTALQLSATGGGGFVTVENGGNIIYNPQSSAIKLGIGVNTSGDGGNLYLGAGVFNDSPVANSNSSLTVTGPIVLSATGNGVGGSVTLAATSVIAFNVGATTGNINGVQGGITVNGAGSGINGSVSIQNYNGSVITSVPLTAVDSLQLTAGGPTGAVTVGAALGSSTTTLIGLNGAGIGAITESGSKTLVTAATVSFTNDDSGNVGASKTPFAINAANILIGNSTTFLFGNSVYITDSAAAVSLNTPCTANGDIVIAAPKGTLTTENVIAYGNVNLSATSVTVNGNIFAADNKSVIITATTGNITDSGANQDISGGTVNLSAAKGMVTADQIGADGTTHGVSISAMTGINILDTASGDSSINLTTKGSVVAASLKSVGPTGTITINSGGGVSIASTADIDATNNISIKAATTVALGNTTDSIATNGSIIVTSSSGNITSQSSGNIYAANAVTLTATKGLISTGTIGIGTSVATTIPNTISLIALSGINVNGDLEANNTISAKTTSTSTDPTQGRIVVTNAVVTLSSVGAVTLTASGTGTGVNEAISIADDVTGNKSITLTAAKGGVAVLGLGFTGLESGAVSVTAANNISIGADGIIANSSVNLKTTGTTVGNGDISVSGPVAALGGNTGVVNITASGADNNAIALAGDASGGKSITLTAAKGGIDLNSTGAVVATPIVTVVALNNITDTGLIAAVGAVSLKTTGTTASGGIAINGGISTAAGAITVVSASKSLIVGDGAQIIASSQSAKTPATILLENSNTKTGTISIGSANIATSGAGGGAITVTVGAAKSVAGTNPNTAGITVSGASSTGQVFFGAANTIDPTSTGTIVLQGANMIFSSSSKVQDAIIFNGATFNPDPPVLSAPLSNASGLVTRDAATGATLFVVPPITLPVPTSMGLAANTIAAPVQLAGLSNLNALTSTPPGHSTYNWINETEIDGGEIPVTVANDGPKLTVLNKGSVLVMPTTDTVIQTPFGEVKIAAKSIVMVIAFGRGVAVYNFDDVQQGAVSIKTASRSFVLQPGSSIVVSDSARSFAEVNPAQLVCYRHITEYALTGDLKAYKANFAMHSAMAAVAPLRSIALSKHKESGRLTNHLLKTSAILMQLQSGGEDFKQYVRPQMTAMVSSAR